MPTHLQRLIGVLTDKRSAAMCSLVRIGLGRPYGLAAPGIPAAIIMCTSLPTLPKLSHVEFHAEYFLSVVTIATKSRLGTTRCCRNLLTLQRCHPTSLHERMKCLKPCERIHETCGHRCNKLCGDRCGDCVEPLPPVQLPCGHEVLLKCSERTDGEIQCTHLIESIPLPCGHTVDDICSNKEKTFECKESCGMQLPCGHLCSGTCSLCRNSSTHPPCQSYCNAERDCGHKCLSLFVYPSLFHAWRAKDNLAVTKALVHLVSNLAGSHANMAAARESAARYVTRASNPVVGTVLIRDNATLCAVYLAHDFHAASPVTKVTFLNLDEGCMVS